jgi:hypothetical protein
MRILLSSSSEFAVVLRLILFLINLRAIGDICFRGSPLSNTARIGLGLGVSFLAVFVGSALQHGSPGTITPIILYALLAAGWVSLVLRLRSFKREARFGVLVVLAAAVPYLLLLVVAWIVVHADWPRWVPLTSDPQQNAFFMRKVIDYHCIPRVLAEMGDSPLNYPAGTGVLGYLIYSFSGLLPAESVSLLNGVFLLLFSLALVEAAHAARLPMAQRCLLAVIPFMVGVGGFAAWAGHPGTGKNVVYWLSQIWLVQLFLMKRSAPSLLPLLVQFILLLTVAAELNPMLAIFWAWIGLLTIAILKSEGGLAWRRVIAGVILMGVTFSLMIAVDPFFHDTLMGRGVPSPTMDHLPKGKIHFQFSGESHFVGNLARHLLALVQSHPRKGVFFLALVSIILLGNVKALLGRTSPKTFLLGVCAALLPSVLLVAISTYLAIPAGSAAVLVVPYNMQVLTLTLWMAAFVLAVWSLNSVSALFHSRWIRLVWAGVSILGFSVSAWCYGIEPHLQRHASPKLSGMPPVNLAVPPGLAEATRAVADLWSKDPNAKVLFVNWEWTLSSPERWIMVDHYSSAVALLCHSNPAFFFFKGSTDYSYDNYFSRVCFTWDADWLMSRGIRWILLPPKAMVDQRCVSLREAASPGQYEIKSVALLRRDPSTAVSPPEPRDP